MNQSAYIINLYDITNNSHPFGNKQGKKAFEKLQEIVETNPSIEIFGISLADIEATDASFPRESVVTLAKLFRGEKGFYLIDFKSKDLIDNWNYAALAKEQPLIIWENNDYQVIGSDLKLPAKKLLDFVVDKGMVTTAMVAKSFDMSTQNASSKLKRLYNQGLILGSKEVADSGGLEFLYRVIK